MRRRIAAKPTEITVAQAKGQMVAFLYACRPVALSAVTLDDLVHRYRIDRRTAEYELTIAKQKRAGEIG